MDGSQFKGLGIRTDVKEASARRRQRSRDKLKKAYWAMLASDDRIIKANDAVIRALDRLKMAGKWNPKAEPDPDLAWGELLIHGTPNPKRRADDQE